MRPAHETRLMRGAYLALVPAAGLALALATMGEGAPFGVPVPALLPILLVVAGLALGAFATHRRSVALALVACVLLVLAVVPAGVTDPGLLDHALGLLLGVLILAYGELVHMTTRQNRGHVAGEKAQLPQVHLDRVASEAMKTLALRGLLALALAGLGIGLAFLLATLGPLRLREAVETRAHIGVAVASLALMGALGLFILVRGALAPRPDPASQESAPDVQA